MAAAVKLYELGRLSSGAAARLAGVPRVIFLARLADYGVDTFQVTEAQLLRETWQPRERCHSLATWRDWGKSISRSHLTAARAIPRIGVGQAVDGVVVMPEAVARYHIHLRTAYPCQIQCPLYNTQCARYN